MAEEEAKKVEVEVTQEPEAAPAAAAEAVKEDVAEEKAVIPATEPPAADEKPADDSKALAIVESEYCYDWLCFFFLSMYRKAWDGNVVVVCWSVLYVLGIGRNFPHLPLLGSSSLYFLVAVQWRY